MKEWLKFLVGMSLLSNLYAGEWIEKTHTDFADGQEYYYVGRCQELRTWQIGAHVYSPAQGGLRIIQRDWDLDNNGYLDVVVTRWDQGQVRIYWNSRSGFNISNYTVLTGIGEDPEGVTAADLNFDGYEDIMITCQTPSGAYIFYGSSSGYSSTPDDSVLPLPANQKFCPVDINNDGYLDLFLTGDGDNIYLFEGPPPFHSKQPVDTLHWLGRILNLTPCDLNYDGYLDLVASRNWGNIRIFWGPNFDSYLELACANNMDHSIADLNEDGFLDIVVNTKYEDLIFWGSSDGYSDSDMTILGQETGGGNVSIADLNNDGAIDLVFSGYPFGYLYWGPHYLTQTRFPGFPYARAVEIADWNKDSLKDILLGSYIAPTYLYWNSPMGFDTTNRFTFPDHSNDALWEDLGNLWNRSNEERYLSNVYKSEEVIEVDSVEWFANVPEGCNLQVWIRSAMDTIDWEPWERVNESGCLCCSNEGRFLQYRVVFLLDYMSTTEFHFDSIKTYFHQVGIDTTLLSIENSQGIPGTNGNPVFVKLTNEEPVAGIQATVNFDGTLLHPEDVTVVDRGREMNMEWTGWDDSLKLVLYSDIGNYLPPGAGNIIRLAFYADSQAPIGDSTLLQLTNVVASDPYANPVSIGTQDGWMRFLKGMKGDVNGDGSINILDVVRCANIILGIGDPSTHYELWAADVAPPPDGDGEVNILDLVGIVDLILHGYIPEASDTGKARISIPSIPKRDNIDLPVKFQNTVPVGGVQLHFKLDPNTIEPSQPTLTSRTHGFSIKSKTSGNELLIIMFSPAGRIIKAGDGTIIRIPLHIRGNVTEDSFVLTKAVVASPSANEISVELVEKQQNPTITLFTSPVPCKDKLIIDCFLSSIPVSLPKIVIFDLSGRQVKSILPKHIDNNHYRGEWDLKTARGKSVPSGCYFIHVSCGKYSTTRKVVVISSD